MKQKVLVTAVSALLSSSVVAAQDSDKTREAKPERMGEWAASIQADYPSAALRNREEGTVAMQLTINPLGRVSSCSVVSSSGSTALDNAACEGMSVHARYSPALDPTGKPAYDSRSQRIQYVLPEGVMPEPIDLAKWSRLIESNYPQEAIDLGISGSVIVIALVGEDGQTVGCLLPSPEPHPIFGSAACAGMIRYARFKPPKKQSSYAHTVNHELAN